MSLASVRAGLVTRLETISGLRVPSQVPDQINPPMALVLPDRIDFDESFGSAGLDEMVFAVTLVAGRVSERTAQALLDGWCDPAAATSVKAAIEADRTLGGAAHTCRVTEMRSYGPLAVGDAAYLSAEFVIRVHASQ